MLHFESAFEYRSRSFVWFLITLLNPLIYLLFWRGSVLTTSSSAQISFSEIFSYYLFLILVGALLTVHIEEGVALIDIKEGGLSKYLLRPVSYFWMKFFEEIPFRIIQSLYAFIILVCIHLFLKGNAFGVFNTTRIIQVVLIVLCAFFISFIFKMLLGLSAFWFVDYHGLHEFVNVLFFIFGGFVIPIFYFNPMLRSISSVLPFAYMIYYPVRVLQGALRGKDAWQIIGIQIFWLVSLSILYQWAWRKGVKKFTGIGQ